MSSGREPISVQSATFYDYVPLFHPHLNVDEKEYTAKFSHALLIKMFYPFGLLQYKIVRANNNTWTVYSFSSTFILFFKVGDMVPHLSLVKMEPLP